MMRRGLASFGGIGLFFEGGFQGLVEGSPLGRCPSYKSVHSVKVQITHASYPQHYSNSTAHKGTRKEQCEQCDKRDSAFEGDGGTVRF